MSRPNSFFIEPPERELGEPIEPPPVREASPSIAPIDDIMARLEQRARDRRNKGGRQ